MKISEPTLNVLANAITGENGTFFYRSGPKLIQFFNQFGGNDVYENFPSRGNYTRGKLNELNGTKKLRDVIEAVVDPRAYLDLTGGNTYAVDKVVELLNRCLIYDGHEILKEGIYYKVRSIIDPTKNPLHPVKNIIFAANGPKPDIVLNDAITNEIKITKNEQYCLVYDAKIPKYGLLWWELVEWWVEKNKLQNLNGREQGMHLYNRLNQSMGSEPERNFFRGYFNTMHQKLGVKLPALVPQVYLHYDPYTIEQLVGEKRLIRQRMDFLLLLPNDKRVVIEVDGIQHYSKDGKPEPSIYAEMTAEDRRLKLVGYDIYRFGGFELYKPERAKQIALEFFTQLFIKEKVEAQ